MGFFSKCCAKTNLPVVAECKGYPHLHNVVAILPNNQKFRGIYDGYGRVGGVSMIEEAEKYVENKTSGSRDWHEDGWKKIKFVLSDYYEDEDYKDLPKSYDEMAQGYFMSRKFLDYCMMNGPFKSRAEYTKMFKKLADW
jgi:hypothetical protein